jgi:nuclear pore complex protein Nup188
VLEWQNRPAGQLLGGFSGEETTSLQNAAAADNFRISLGGAPPPDIAQRTAQRGDSARFLDKDARQLRLLHLYISEKRYILKVAQLLLSSSLQKRLPSSYDTPAEDKRETQEVLKLTNIEELAETIFKLHPEERNFLPKECVDAIQSRLEALEKGSGWFNPEDANYVIEMTWQENAIAEATHIMQILFLQLQSSKTIPSAELLLSWLRLMAKYTFLEHFSTVCRLPLHCFEPALTSCL